MQKKMIIIMLLAVIGLGFSTLKTKANPLPNNAYNVPWSDTDNYVILNYNETYISVTSSGTIYLAKQNSTSTYTQLHSSQENIRKMYLLDMTTGLWNNVPLYNVNRYNASGYSNTLFTIGNIAYSSQDLYDSLLNETFTKASFLSTAMARKLATMEALEAMSNKTMTHFGTLLPVGLAILSLLLLPVLLAKLVRLYME